MDTIRSLSQSTELAGEEVARLRLLKESAADALLTGRLRAALLRLNEGLTEAQAERVVFDLWSMSTGSGFPSTRKSAST